MRPLTCVRGGEGGRGVLAFLFSTESLHIVAYSLPVLIWGLWWPPAPWLLAARSQHTNPSTAFTLMLMVVVLCNCQSGHVSETRLTEVDDRRHGIVICLKFGVVPPPTPTGPVKRDW